MTRISRPNQPLVRPQSTERTASETTPTTLHQPSNSGVSSFERVSSTRPASTLNTNTHASGGTSLSTLAMSEIQEVNRTANTNTVELKPMEMLGNLHNGNVYVDMPLDRSFIKSGAISVADDAKVRVRFAVKDGEIDFKNSKVDLDGVRALGLFKVRGAYFTNKGKLRVDMAGPDINISKAVVGESRVPRKMSDFARALENKHGGQRESNTIPASTERRGGNRLDSHRERTRRTENRGPSTLDKLDGLKFRAEGIALQPNKALSLGEGNSVDFKPGTRLDMKGDLHNVELSGRVDLNHFALNSKGTGVELDEGKVDFKATATRSSNGSINADVSLKNLNLNAPNIAVGLGDNEGLNIRNARLNNGEISANISVGADKRTEVSELHTKGNVSAGAVEYSDEGRVVKGGNLSLNFDAHGGVNRHGVNVGNISISELNGEVERMTLPSEGSKTFSLENATVRNASFDRRKNAAGDFEHSGNIENFKGTLGGEINIKGRRFKGELTGEKTTIEGNLKYTDRSLDGDLKVSETNLELNNANIPLAEGRNGEINIRNASLTSDQPNAIHLEGRKIGFEGGGRLTGELGRSELRFGDRGSLTIADGATANLNVEAARVGRVDGDSFLEANGSVEGRIESGSLRIAGDTAVNLKNADVNLNLDKLKVGADNEVELVKGDARINLDIGGDIDRAMLARAGVKSVRGAEGSLTLDIKDAELNNRGELSAKTAHIDLKASVDEIRGRVHIPGVTDASDVHDTPEAPVAGEYETYTVKRGDYLSRIARNHNTTVSAMSELNGISDPNRISVGQELKIPGTQKAVPAPAPAPTPVAEAAASTAASATNATRSADKPEVVLPTPDISLNMAEPLNVNPMKVAGRIHNGELDVKIPLNEEGLENASKILGVRTIDLDPNTSLNAKLVVKDGEIQFDKSSFKFSHTPEALGFVDIEPRVTKDGEVEVEIAGLDINITKFAVGADRIPAKVSDFADLMTPAKDTAAKPTAPASSSGAARTAAPASTTSTSSSVNDALDLGRTYVNLGEVEFSAKGVSLAPGRLSIGDNDYIDVGADNKLNISGNSREVKVDGTIDARDAFVDVGDAQLDLGTGRIEFDANIVTGLDKKGRLSGESRIDFNFRVPEASVDRMSMTQPGGQRIELRSGSIRNAELRSSHSFAVGPSGDLEHIADKSSTTFTLPHFDGDIRNTRVGLTNKDGSQGHLEIAAAKSTGSLNVEADGRIRATLSVDELDASVDGLDLGVPGTTLKGLDGGVTGHGELSFDNAAGVVLEGDFNARVALEDGQMELNGYTELDLARDSRANLSISRLDTTKGFPQVRGSLSIDAALDKGKVALPDNQSLSFEEGSKLSLTAALGEGANGQELTMNGDIYARLGRQRFHHIGGRAEVSGEVLDGMAKIDLGEIKLGEDGRYRITNPDVEVSLDLNLFGRQH